MARQKRCSNCGASNPESAQWCSLCLERFDKPQPESEPAPSDDAESTSETPSAEAALPQRSGRTPDYSAFKVTDEGIKWICPACDSANDLDMAACSVCGTTFADAVRPKPERPQRDPATVALFSLFLPGAGHAYIGMWGQAVARGILWLWVLLVSIVGLLDKDVPGSLLMATIFGVAAFGFWVVGAHDAYREARNEPKAVLLRGKRFLYVVLGLMGLLFLMMFGALLSARGGTDNAISSMAAWRYTSSPIFTGLRTS